MAAPKSPKAMAAALLASPEDTETQFYEALQAGDLDRVMAVWADDDEIACVHPGGPRLVGPGPIRASFDAMFANGAIDARAAQVRQVLGPGSAVHHVVEEVRVPTDEGLQVAYVLATNVYVKTPQGWRMVCHHASPSSPRSQQEIAESASTLH
jgi:uncharacterized protein (TIGR02246 family)